MQAATAETRSVGPMLSCRPSRQPDFPLIAPPVIVGGGTRALNWMSGAHVHSCALH